MSHSAFKYPNHKIAHQGLAAILLCLSLISSASHALGLSTFRIYLDNQQRSKNFIVYNKDQYTQHCKQSLRHYEVDPQGRLNPLPDDALPPIAANSWIRFSPKHFSLSPGTSQAVKFQLKRRAKTEPAEYRAHLSLECSYDKEEIKQNNDVQFGLQPTLRHNIPIIVRTGKLDASLNFSKISLHDNMVSVDLERQGQRSVYGRLELVDSRTDKVINTDPHITLYQETRKKTVNLSTKGIAQKYLILRFSEEKQLQNRIVVQHTLG
jgi:P pilus assembly chaperone PapD